jgi:C1A family cysteine protease
VNVSELKNIDQKFKTYMQDKQSGLDDQNQSDKKLGYIPDPVRLASRTVSKKQTNLQKTKLPSKFNSCDLGTITSAKDQGYLSSCWAFGSTAALETACIKLNLFDKKKINCNDSDDDDRIDLSEANAIYNLSNGASIGNEHDFTFGPYDGGNFHMILAYWSRFGATDERLDRYCDAFDYSKQIPIFKSRSIDETESILPTLAVNDVSVLAYSPSSYYDVVDHRNDIKERILEHGSVFASMCYEDACFTKKTAAYYDKFDYWPNHLVQVVGWDDEFPREAFFNSVDGLPECNGAFLVKNSWGTDWGDNGFFWVSFGCPWFSELSACVTDVESISPSDVVYQDDYLGLCDVFSLKKDKAICKVFDLKSQREKLTSVSLYTLDNDVKVELYSAELDDDGMPMAFGKKLKEVTFDDVGYHTIKLTRPVELTGERFGVIIKLTTGGLDDSTCGVESAFDGYSDKARGTAGSNFIIDLKGYRDAEDFTEDRIVDLYETYHACTGLTNLCVKARTEQVSD